MAGEVQGERLVDRLAAAGRRSMLVDRQDMLSRHVTGALGRVLTCQRAREQGCSKEACETLEEQLLA